MKKIFLLLAIAIVASGILLSCCYEEKVSGDITALNQKEIRILSNILMPSPYSLDSTSFGSRIMGGRWEESDAIGIYMLEKGTTAVVGSVGNVKYVTTHGGYTGSFVSEYDKVYFPANGSEVRFMSYHPYNEYIDGAIYKVDVSDQTSQSNIDLLYSFNTSATYGSGVETGRVSLDFERQLVKLYINVKNGGDFQWADLMNMKVHITGLNTKADFNLLTGELSALSGILPISPSVLIAGGGNVYSGEAILIPASGASNAEVVISLNDGTFYTWGINDVFEKGKQYTYDVIVTRSGISVNSKIQNWHVVLQDTSIGN